ncbi:hypothetical protein [Chamaesiphon sp.]|uniref:hypothetical protein n=1 Tax=Chamaesiphon sp. TaxID=2814140 RepID=UPI0035938410
MTFTSIASKSTHDLTVLNTIKLSKISVAGSLVAIVGVTVLQNLLWMQVSSPAELPTHQRQAASTTVK